MQPPKMDKVKKLKSYAFNDDNAYVRGRKRDINVPIRIYLLWVMR